MKKTSGLQSAYPELTQLKRQRQTSSIDWVPAGAIDGDRPKFVSTVRSKLK